MIINHNIAALNANRQLEINGNNTQKALQKLSSGMRINSAADDAAGLAISEKMRGQIKGLEQAQRNAQDGVSLLQTGEGALNETQDMLQRMRELAVQSANDTNTADDRKQLQQEVDQLANAINDISKNTDFNTQKLFAGDFKATFQVGANADQNLTINLDKMDSDSLNVAGKYTAGTETDIKVKDRDGNDLTVSGDTNVLKSGDNVKGIWVNDGYYSTNDVVAEKDTTSGAINLKVKDGAEKISSGDKDGNALTDGDTIVNGGIDISSSQDAANKAITTIDNAINKVSTQRSKIGAVQNRLEHTINNLGTSDENITAAESRIRDVDYALAA
ncbi:flagellin [Scopulibacillus cellulosilyticus]|uniref:Flagellin n=1 Tax=Scopulibacillus cellulosilyticus TaxID=2665665 RepID=A0ABW2PWV5_9BACL